MRASSLALFALAAVATPIYAAPLTPPVVCNVLTQRCVSSIARSSALNTAREDYNSEAINLGSVGKIALKALPTIIGAVPSIFSLFHR